MRLSTQADIVRKPTHSAKQFNNECLVSNLHWARVGNIAQALAQQWAIYRLNVNDDNIIKIYLSLFIGITTSLLLKNDLYRIVIKEKNLNFLNDVSLHRRSRLWGRIALGYNGMRGKFVQG